MNLKSLVLKIIRIYQRTISPDHGILKHTGMMRCRFYPSCSEYGYRAIDNKGLIKGSLRAISRIARCNPMFSGGVDESYQ